jgi:hypothetical protein
MHTQKHLTKRMQKKGWSQEELEHLNLTLAEHQSKHLIFSKTYDKSHHWIMLILLVLINVAGFALLIPFYILFNEWAYILTAIYAIALGFVLDAAIKTTSQLEGHHHIFSGLITPMISIISLLTITYYLQQHFHVALTINYLNAAIAYAIIIQLPYYTRILIEKIWK